MSYYLLGSIIDIIKYYYSDIYISNIIHNENLTLSDTIKFLKENSTIYNNYKDCDYLIICTYNNTSFHDFNSNKYTELLLELDHLLKHTPYFLISSNSFSSVFDIEKSLCKDSYIRMFDIFEGLEFLRNFKISFFDTSSNYNYLKSYFISTNLENYLVQSICHFQNNHYSELQYVHNNYFFGFGKHLLYGNEVEHIHYKYKLPVSNDVISFFKNYLISFHYSTILRIDYYKDLLLGNNCNEYDIIYCDSNNSTVNNIIDNTINNFKINDTNFFIYNSNDIINGLQVMNNLDKYDIINKIIDIEEYTICIFIIMTKCKRLFFISSIYDLWKKCGIINILEDFYDINVFRISY